MSEHLFLKDSVSVREFSKEVQTALPGKKFKIRNFEVNERGGRVESANGVGIFNDELTSEEITTFEGIVSEHKVGYEDVILQNNKSLRISEVDYRTRELISNGFTYDGNLFSMSEFAQINWDDIKANSTDYSFPLEIPTKTYKYSLTQGNLNAFWGAKSDFKWGYLDSGRALNVSITDATTQTELDAVIDNR